MKSKLKNPFTQVANHIFNTLEMIAVLSVVIFIFLVVGDLSKNELMNNASYIIIVLSIASFVYKTINDALYSSESVFVILLNIIFSVTISITCIGAYFLVPFIQAFQFTDLISK